MLGSIPYLVPLGIWVDEKLEMRWKYWRGMNRISNYNSKYLCWIYHICIPVNKINATIKNIYSLLMGGIKMESHSKFIFEWITSIWMNGLGTPQPTCDGEIWVQNMIYPPIHWRTAQYISCSSRPWRSRYNMNLRRPFIRTRVHFNRRMDK